MPVQTRSQTRAKKAREAQTALALAKRQEYWAKQRRAWLRDHPLIRPKQRVPHFPTPEEIRAASIRRNGLREADRFLELNIAQTRLPSINSPPREVRLADEVRDNDVRIVVSVGEVVHHEPECPFVDDSTFSLYLQVLLPPEQGFHSQYNESPTFMLDAWFGLADDWDAPFWLNHRHAPGPVFWMDRDGAVELARICALEDRNSTVRERILSWCEVISCKGERELSPCPPSQSPSPCPSAPSSPLKIVV